MKYKTQSGIVESLRGCIQQLVTLPQPLHRLEHPGDCSNVFQLTLVPKGTSGIWRQLQHTTLLTILLLDTLETADIANNLLSLCITRMEREQNKPADLVLVFSYSFVDPISLNTTKTLSHNQITIQKEADSLHAS